MPMGGSGNYVRGEGPINQAGAPRLTWDGMLLSGIVGPTTLASPATQATVAKFSRSAYAYILAIDETAGVPSSGIINLSWLGQSITCNWNQDAASLQTTILALTNVQTDATFVVGGPLPGIPLLFRLWPVPASRVGSGRHMTIGSNTLNKGTPVFQQGLGYSGKTDTLTIYDPQLEADSGSYCSYEKRAPGILVPYWVSCKGDS